VEEIGVVIRPADEQAISSSSISFTEVPPLRKFKEV